jgi:hypothetical protein
LLTLPHVVQAVIDDYVTRVQAELPGLMVGMYLHGSLALDAFTPEFSDIDFIAVTSRRCTDGDVEHLAAIHQAVERTHPQPALQGSYLQACDLGKFEDTIEPQPCYSDGVLRPSGHHDINAVTWWLLKNRGVVIVGTDPKELSFSVDWDRLTADMKINLNTYWVRFTHDPARIAWLLSDYGIQWTVLGVLRQYYTFTEKSITSKASAGEYALKHLPVKWHKLVQEALNIRNRNHATLYRSRLGRGVEAFRFIKLVIRLCNTQFP